jgi:hypothetical protein
MGVPIYCMGVKHGLVKKKGTTKIQPTIVKFVRLTKRRTGIGRIRDKIQREN